MLPRSGLSAGCGPSSFFLHFVSLYEESERLGGVMEKGRELTGLLMPSLNPPASRYWASRVRSVKEKMHGHDFCDVREVDK